MRKLLNLITANRQNRDELIAGIPAHEIRRPNERQQQNCKLSQKSVARLMPQLIIHRLEAVKVHHHHREAVAMSSGAVGLLLEPISQSAGVWKTCQKIGERARLRYLVMSGVGDRVGSELCYRFHEPQMISGIRREVGRVKRKRAEQRFSLYERKYNRRSIRLRRRQLEHIKVETRITV